MRPQRKHERSGHRRPSRSALTNTDRRLHGLILVAALIAAPWASDAPAQEPAAAPTTPSSPTAAPADALEQLVARIALYPDDLIAIILPAATNPLQVVQADRFLEKRKTDPQVPVDEKWDDAVKSLLNYPEVVKSMSADLDWTAALGEAVVADQGDVLDAIQAFRRKTQAAGNLKTDPKQVVVVEKEVIKIVPADPQVIYVPQYSPTTVVVQGGYPSMGYYPAPYPVYHYPYAPGATFAAGLIWGAAISTAWNGNRYEAHYGGDANINIDRDVNINTGNIRAGNVNVDRPAQQPSGGGSTAWKSNKQPGQVSRSVGAKPPARVGNTQAARGAAAAPVATQTSARPAGTNPTTSRAGAAGPSAGTTAGQGAFDGYGSARQAQLDSSRGAASRGARPSPSATPRASRGGARGGGR